MKKNFFAFVVFISCGVWLYSCNSKDKLSNATLGVSYKEYLPMSAGSVRFYRMDSTAPTAFGAAFVTHSYIAKDTVLAQRLDAVGDTTFDVYRYITDTLQTQPWQLATIYQITYTKNQTADLIQSSGLRFVELAMPVQNGINWNGTSYFITPNSGSYLQPGDIAYPYSNWHNFVYDSVGASYSTAYGGVYTNTVIVNEAADTIPPNSVFSDTLYQQVQYSQKVYAQNVGLIYQNTVFYLYQPPNAVFNGSGFDTASFGIRLQRIQ